MHLMVNNDFFKYGKEIYFFIKQSEEYFNEYQKHLFEYADSKNALLTVLFGSFGDIFVDSYSEIKDHKKKEIFLFIEKSMLSKDNYLTEIIGTGLIESIVINAENKNLFQHIYNICGEKTQDYIRQWSNSQGIVLPTVPVDKPSKK